jgi:hypothetical protein
MSNLGTEALSDHQIATLTRDFLDAEQGTRPLVGELEAIDCVIEEFEGASTRTLSYLSMSLKCFQGAPSFSVRNCSGLKKTAGVL